jgi:D-serine deaminase-like pyridoxal phosphate-dependent protein
VRPATIADIDTPAVLIDLDRVEANLTRAQTYADAHGLKLRPHIKTHKLPLFAHRQIALGAVGITCQKIGEAEVMAQAGIGDILIPYNIIGRDKLTRLRSLHERITLAASADSAFVAAGLSEAFSGMQSPLTVLVECDTGMGRCGVTTPEATVALATGIARSPGLRFGGLMTYPAAGNPARTEAWLSEAVAALRQAGLDVPVVSSGGTPDLWRAHEVETATEHRPGTYIYLDRKHVETGMCGIEDCALTVLATVVSHPDADRAVIDAGSKTLSSDTLGLTGFGMLVDHPEVVIKGLSEEHGHLTNAGALNIGERVRVLPNHACVVSNLFDVVHLVSGDEVLDIIPVAARGRVG